MTRIRTSSHLRRRPSPKSLPPSLSLSFSSHHRAQTSTAWARASSLSDATSWDRHCTTMRRDALYAGVASLLLAATQAIHLLERSAQPAVVGFDLQKKHTPAQFARSRLRRRASGGPATVVLDNEVGAPFGPSAGPGPDVKPRRKICTSPMPVWERRRSNYASI